MLWCFICLYYKVIVLQVPFSLCLRVWDIYLLDGERVITAMAYTILKLHKRNLMKLNDMDSIVHFIQVRASFFDLKLLSFTFVKYVAIQYCTEFFVVVVVFVFWNYG